MFKKYLGASDKLIGNSGAILLSKVTGLVFSYFLIITITKVFGADIYGRYSIVILCLDLCALLSCLGLTTGIVKFTSNVEFFNNGQVENNYFVNSFYVISIFSIVISLLFYVGAEALAIDVFSDKELVIYFKILAYTFPFFVWYTFLCEFLRGRSKFIEYGLFRHIFLPLLTLLILLCIIVFDNTEISVFFSYVISFVILASIMLLRLPFKKVYSKTSFSVISLLKVSFPMMISSAFIFFMNWTDVFMLGVLVTKAELGVYNIAYKIAALSLFITISINSVMAPKFSLLYSKKDYDNLKEKLLISIRIASIITIPVVLFTFLFRKQILSLFGHEFLDGELALVIILFSVIINSMTAGVGVFLNMTNNQKELQKYTLYSALLNVFLNFILIHFYGFVGAALATALSSILLNILCVRCVNIKFGFYPFLTIKLDNKDNIL